MVRRGGVVNLEVADKNFFARPKELFDILKYASFARGLPSREVLQTAGYSSVLKHMVERGGGSCKQDDLSGFATGNIEKLVENGWVHTETLPQGGIEYSFASPLHHWSVPP